jgi:hypothetical protein
MKLIGFRILAIPARNLPRSAFTGLMFLMAWSVQLAAADAQTATLTLDLTQNETLISPTFYGLMTEEINHSYDGGLYAELIQNRSFKDDPKRPVNWSVVQKPQGEAQISLDADIVVMNCYAPMLTRVEPAARQWCPNMIGYNGLSSFGSPSYYAQVMFNANRADLIVPASMVGEPRDFFYSATRSSKTGTIYLKAVNRSPEAIQVDISLKGITGVSPNGQTTVLSSADPQAVNSLEFPRQVVPVTSEVNNLSSRFTQSFAANSISCLKLEVR